MTTRDGRVVSCCVRSVGKQRPHLRWMFTMVIAGQDDVAMFTGPIYIRGEHDDHDAVQTLVDDWWETNKVVDDANDHSLRRIPRRS